MQFARSLPRCLNGRLFRPVLNTSCCARFASSVNSATPDKGLSQVEWKQGVQQEAPLPSNSLGNGEEEQNDVPQKKNKKKKLTGFKSERVTIIDIKKKYKKGEKLAFMSAYDYPSASLADKAGVDCILVGDSVGMVVMGQKSTIPVTMDEIIYHCRGVVRGSSRAYLLGDMPFGSFLDSRDAVMNASRIIKEGGVDGVKLEGGRDVADQVRAIARSGILVVGHIGLTPQSASALGGFRTQGRNAKAALDLLEDALVLEEAGCSMILIECVPPLVAKYITDQLSIPTIGIGAGPHCSAQIQIFHDLVGMFDMFKPRFSKQYIDIGSQIEQAIHDYVGDVKDQQFPNASQCYSIKEKQYKQFVELAENHLAQKNGVENLDFVPQSHLNGMNRENVANSQGNVSNVVLESDNVEIPSPIDEVFQNDSDQTTQYQEISWSRQQNSQETPSYSATNGVPNGATNGVSKPPNGYTSSPLRRSSQKMSLNASQFVEEESEWLIN